MTKRDKQIIAGAVLVGVGLLVLTEAYKSNKRVINASNRTRRKQSQEEKQPIVTEDIDYVEVYDENTASEPETVVIIKQEEPVKTDKWYSKLMFWRWKLWSKF